MLSGWLAAGVAGASIIWQILPPSTAIVAGQSVTVAAQISGKPVGTAPSIGSFDFDVSFNPALLTPSAVTFGPFLGTPGTEALTDFNFLPGLVDFASVSLLSPDQLNTLQPASFTLASLTFVAIGSGTASFSFADAIVDDAFGVKIPEPGAGALLTVGLIGLAMGATRFRFWSYP
jgi:hypothetical protein